MLLASCIGGAPEPASGPGGEKLLVVTSIYPLEYFARRIGGEAVDVVNLVPPGMEAHTFELSPDGARTLAGAGVVVMNGLGLEPWLERALDALGERRPSIVVAAGVVEAGVVEPGSVTRAIAGDELGEADPHLWLDPLLAIAQAERVRDALVRAAPEEAERFDRGASALVEDLVALDSRFRSALASCRHDRFVTSHAAYAHLAARYGMEQMPVSGLSPDAKPSARRLAELSDEMTALGIRYVLVESASIGRLEQALAREVRAQVLTLHSLGSVTSGELAGGADYLSLMENNANVLAQALECAV